MVKRMSLRAVNTAARECKRAWLECIKLDCLKGVIGPSPGLELAIERADQAINRAVDQLVEAHEAPDERIRAKALTVLRQAGPWAVRRMIEVMNATPSPALRLNLIRMLGLVGKSEAVIVLKEISTTALAYLDAAHWEAFVDATKSLSDGDRIAEPPELRDLVSSLLR